MTSWYLDFGNGTSTGYYGVTSWAASTAKSAGAIVRQLTTPTVGFERCFICYNSTGSTGSSEPAWSSISATFGEKFTDGSVNWIECTGQAGVNGDNGSISTATSAATSSGSILTFSSLPSNIAVGQYVIDKTSPTVIPGTAIVQSFNTSTNTVVLSTNVTGGGIGSGDNITFTNCPPWGLYKSASVTQGIIIQDSACDYLFVCTTTGTAGATEPTWVKTAGSSTTDSGVTWYCLGTVGSFTKWNAPHARLGNVWTTGWAIAGDTTWMGDDHIESQSTAITLTSPGNLTAPCYVNLIDHTVSPPYSNANLKTPSTAAATPNISLSAATVTLTLLGIAEFNGISFATFATTGSSYIGFGSQSPNISSRLQLDNCAVAQLGTGGTAYIAMGESQSQIDNLVVWNNTTLKFGNVSQGITCFGGKFIWKNTTSAISGAIIPTHLFIPYTTSSRTINILLEGVDLSAMGTNSIVNTLASCVSIVLLRCKLASSYVISAAQNLAGCRITAIQCDSGGTNYVDWDYQSSGVSTTNTSIVRTGGNSDGTNTYSYKITTYTNNSWLIPFELFRLSIWNVNIGTVNITVEFLWFPTSGILPTSDQIWFDVEYLGSSSSPLATYLSGTKTSNISGVVSLTASTQAWDSKASQWASSTSYTVGTIIAASTVNPGRLFICTVAGTSSSSIPAAFTSATDGSTFTDNTTLTWQTAVRFNQTLATTPAQPGDIYVYPKIAVTNNSTGIFVDPVITLH